jgi:hypothetical protein
MKSLPILIAALLPVFSLAQETPAAGAAVAAPDPQRLPRVEFSGADLPSIIEFLQAKNQEAGGDAKALNVIVSPGLEKRTVPSLSLRNVTATEVLSIACRVLNLEMEPVMDEQGGDVVAWIVKAGAAGDAGDGSSNNPFGGAMAGAAIGGASSLGAGGRAPSGGPGPADPSVAASGARPYAGEGLPRLDPLNLPVTPPVVELASGGGGTTAEPRSQARVFGIAPLIASSQSDPRESEKERVTKYTRLVDSLQAIARDHGQETQVNAYGEMDIIVVKSRDAGTIQLIAEAIDAMKMNANTTARADDTKASAREKVLQSELEALRQHIEEMKSRKRADIEAERSATEPEKPASR